MSAVKQLFNDKDTILAVLQEYHTLNKQDKETIIIGRYDGHKCSGVYRTIQHGSWVFCYHYIENELYVK